MSAVLLYPQSLKPTSISSWGTEQRPEWNLGTQATGDSYLGLYGQETGNLGALQGSIAVGGGATLELTYEMMSQSDVAKLYEFWQLVILREQQRDRSAFRISPVHCLWTMCYVPRTFPLINQLWAFGDKSLKFEYQGTGECGPGFKVNVSLVSIPEVVSYE